MIRSTGYRLTCDHCGVTREHENYFTLINEARVAGWAIRVRKNGRIVRKGGKDYCPPCLLPLPKNP